MTYSEIIEELNDLKENYRNCSNASRDPSYSYSERVFYLGSAIHSLKQIGMICHEYPAVAKRFKTGFLPDYSDQAIYRLYDRQRELYIERLRALKRNIGEGNYSLGDEMRLKVSRLRDTNAILNGSKNEPPGARVARNRAAASVIGTALKYPVHLISRVLQGGSRIIGQVLAAPLHLISYPMSMIINPDSPYQGRMVQNIGDTLGNVLSTGVRVIDNGIMRL